MDVRAIGQCRAGADLPVTYNSFLQRICPSPRRYVQQIVVRLGLSTGVDLGCGENSFLSPLRGPGSRWVGIDASPARLREAKRRDLLDDYLCADLLEWLRKAAKEEEKCEVLVASHVIEHLDRNAGNEFLGLVEAVATRLIYIETPYGFVEPGCEGDEFSRHRSGWFPWDFEARGYTVFGIGVRGLRGPRHRARLGQERLTRVLERAFQRLSYRHPLVASTVAAIRCVDAAGNLGRV